MRGSLHHPDHALVAKATKRPIQRGNLKSRSTPRPLLGLLQNRIPVARLINDTQEDVKLDTSKRALAVGVHGGPCVIAGD